MAWLDAFIKFGGALLCMTIPVLILGAVLVWLAPRISGFLDSGRS